MCASIFIVILERSQYNQGEKGILSVNKCKIFIKKLMGLIKVIVIICLLGTFLCSDDCGVQFGLDPNEDESVCFFDSGRGFENVAGFDFLEQVMGFSEGQFFDTWMIWKTFYFDIYYYNEILILDVVDNIDNAYESIIDHFGYLFFRVPQRIKIYIYRDKEEFARKTGQSKWAGGCANSKTNAISTYEQKNLMENVLVHELTHLIFDSHMGYPRNLAVTWLHEGLAVYEEKVYFNKRWNLKYFKKLDKEGKVLSLNEALKTHTGLQANTKQVSLWYLEMGILVYYLSTLDKEGFKVFTENLKRYKNANEALKVTYPWNFSSVDELEIAWKKWVYEQGDSL